MTDPSGKFKDSEPAPNLTAGRWVVIIMGALLMLFSGGCSLYLITDFRTDGTVVFDPINGEIISVVGGVPFLVGLIMVLLAINWRR